MAARCLSNHQAAYGQPAIRALATAPLRRLALSVLFTIATYSYQTICTVSERTFNKRQHTNARYGVDFSLFMHYDITHYHPIRFYVMNTDVPRILISHAASYWLGLVKVLCDNKAPRIKRQVASIDKKSDFRAKSDHFRTSTPNAASSSQKKQMTSKMVTSGKVNVPSPRMHSFEDTKIQGGKRAKKLRSGRDVDVSD